MKMDLSNKNPFVDWGKRHGFFRIKILNFLEKIALLFERPVDWIVKHQSLNPLYHTGTITFFLLLVILFTGIYLTMFYQFGFTASYLAVERIEANFVGRIIRAIHRYASGLAVITTLLHGWRTFFMDRFRGPRWLAWVTGIVSTLAIWGAGVTGYWLIWDERAQAISQIFIQQFSKFGFLRGFLLNNLVTDSAGSGWIFVTIVITLHLGLSLLIAIFFYYHIVRLSRPKMMPPAYWNWLVLAVLLLAAIFFPIGNLPPLSTSQLPKEFPLDTLYLLYLKWADTPWSGFVWATLGLVVIFTSLFPWILSRKKVKPVHLIHEKCTGCTLCANDCPYQAIDMLHRTDGARHTYVAKINFDHCVACGICIGSCGPLALTLQEDLKPELLLENVRTIVVKHTPNTVTAVFVCERHAYHGAQQIITGGRDDVEVFPLTCIGMAHPNLAAIAIDSGAKEVRFIGCPPEDCANREGNLWMEDRLKRDRLPKLKLPYAAAPITRHWLSPASFKQGLSATQGNYPATAYRFSVPLPKGLSVLFPAFVVLLAIVAVQLAITYLPFTTNWNSVATIQLGFSHELGKPFKNIPKENYSTIIPANTIPKLSISVDDAVIFEKLYSPQGNNYLSKINVLENIYISPGTYFINVNLEEADQRIQLFSNRVTLEAGELLSFSFLDERLGPDPQKGRQLYFTATPGSNAGCRVCHSLDRDVVLVGPSFYGIGERAATRVEGLTAEEYLRQSIVDPDAYIVEGFPKGQMLKDLDQRLTPEQIDDLIAFLMTLK